MARTISIREGRNAQPAAAAALWAGGFGDAPKLLIVAAGAGGILLVGLAVPEELVEAAISPPVAALLMLAVLGMAAFAWTDAAWQDGLLTALLPAAYAGLAILGFSGSRRSPRGRSPVPSPASHWPPG